MAETAPPTAGSARLFRWEKAGLVLLGLAVAGLGVMTVIRSAYQVSPKTDFQVYARAAWAVRAGEDPYRVTDNNGWHYVYPPALAILMAPLADPYPFLPRDGYLPFGAAAAGWYLLGLGCVAYTVHVLAGAVLPGAARGSRQWWYARLVPVYVCLGGITLTISRGQVNTVIVALIAAGFAAAVRGRRTISGAWLGAAAALKIIPVLMVLFPLVRRDWRGVAGGVAAAAVLVGVLPAAVWGVDGMVAANRRVGTMVLTPAVAAGDDRTLVQELTGAKATHSQSVQGAVHYWVYANHAARPDTADPVAKAAHLAVGGLMIGLTLLAARRRLTPDPSHQLIFLGCLCVLMTLLTPVSHLHYYALVLPLVCGLWLRGMKARPGAIGADARTTGVLIVWGLATALPALPGPAFEPLRDGGFGTVFTIGLWAFALATMGRKPAAKEVTVPDPLPVRRAA